jgi:hypothetical protein
VHCIETILNSPEGLNFKQNSPLAITNTARSATKSIAIALALGMLAMFITGCSSRRMPPHTPAPIPTPAPAPVITPQPDPAPSVGSAPRLPLVASWADYRRRASQMIIAANPGASFVGPQPQQWSGIATVTVMLNADGSIRALDLMRGSRISPEVNDLALAAARRAANYGSVSNLPQPWQFNETFLYNDSNKFQLITIIEGR